MDACNKVAYTLGMTALVILKLKPKTLMKLKGSRGCTVAAVSSADEGVAGSGGIRKRRVKTHSAKCD